MKSYNCKIDHVSMTLPPNLVKNKEFFERIALHKFSKSIGEEAFLQIPKENRLTEAQKVFPLSPTSFEAVTMIGQRYMYDADASLTDVSTEVLQKALKEAGWDAQELDFIIFSSTTNCYLNKSMKIPSTGCEIQEAVGAWNAWAYDMQAACSGWLYPIQQATAFIHSGMAKRGAVVVAEMVGGGLDYNNEKSSPLIGDIATVTLMSYSEDPCVFDVTCQANRGPEIPSDIITLGWPPYTNESELFSPFGLKGKTVYSAGVKSMSQHTKENIEISNQNFGKEPEWFVYHQANGAMLMKILGDMQLDPTKNLYNIDRLANTIGGTIPSVLAENWNSKIKSGDLVSAIAFGGGVTSGRLLFKKP